VCRDGIDVWCAHVGRALATEVRITEVVHEEKKDVRPFRGVEQNPTCDTGQDNEDDR
jgi:hypothetical protein